MRKNKKASFSVQSTAFVITALAVGAVSVGAFRTVSYKADLLVDTTDLNMMTEGEYSSEVAVNTDDVLVDTETTADEVLETETADEFDGDAYSYSDEPSEAASPFEGEILLDGEVQEGDIPSSHQSSQDGYEYIGTATCSNTTVKRDVNATGRTILRTYTKGRAQKKIAQRCALSDAQLSAKLDGLEAFKNSCGLPDSCKTGCDSKGLRFQYNPDPPKITFKDAEHRADDIMNCPGGKSYSTTATVKGDCTSVRYCEAATASSRGY